MQKVNQYIGNQKTPAMSGNVRLCQVEGSPETRYCYTAGNKWTELL